MNARRKTIGVAVLLYAASLLLPAGCVVIKPPFGMTVGPDRPFCGFSAFVIAMLAPFAPSWEFVWLFGAWLANPLFWLGLFWCVKRPPPARGYGRLAERGARPVAPPGGLGTCHRLAGLLGMARQFPDAVHGKLVRSCTRRRAPRRSDFLRSTHDYRTKRSIECSPVGHARLPRARSSLEECRPLAGLWRAVEARSRFGHRESETRTGPGWFFCGLGAFWLCFRPPLSLWIYPALAKGDSTCP
jgi:hypothetical protein